MSPAPITRRALVGVAGAALGAAALPAGICAALAAERPSTGLPGAAAPAFDAAAYVADLEAIGCTVYLARRRSGPGWAFGIASPAGLGFGEDFRAAMERWDAAIVACPDHVERVTVHLAERGA